MKQETEPRLAFFLIALFGMLMMGMTGGTAWSQSVTVVSTTATSATFRFNSAVLFVVRESDEDGISSDLAGQLELEGDRHKVTVNTATHPDLTETVKGLLPFTSYVLYYGGTGNPRSQAFTTLLRDPDVEARLVALESHVHADLAAQTDLDSHTHADLAAGTHTHADLAAGTHTHTDAPAHTHMDAPAHTHDDLAAQTHTHTDAPAHTHTDVDLAAHTHTDAPAHAHADLAAGTHTHDDLAAGTHTHTDAPAHTHDDLAAGTHMHTDAPAHTHTDAPAHMHDDLAARTHTHDGSSVLGFQEENDRMAFVPNPTNDSFTIRGIDSYNRIDVYDARGQILHTQYRGFLVDLARYPQGTYIVRVRTRYGTHTRQLVKE